MSTDQAANRQFEDRVREIARTLWPSSAYGGAAMYDAIERDGVFETPDVVHIVEATTSRRKEPITHNATKTADLIRDLRPSHPDQILKGWLVTHHEPTADQREAVGSVLKRRKNVNIVICSYSQFVARLVDASTYLSLRDNYGFGSARNLRVLNDFKNVGDYIDMDLIEAAAVNNPYSKAWSVNELIKLFFREQKEYCIGRRFWLRQKHDTSRNISSVAEVVF
jgi:hypothetical protein